MHRNNGKMAEFGKLVENQWQKCPEGASLLTNLSDKLKMERSNGACFVAHTIDKTSVSDKQMILIISNSRSKEAFEAILDIGIAFNDTRIIVATNGIVANRTIELCHEKTEEVVA